jgi:hypothetical protein
MAAVTLSTKLRVPVAVFVGALVLAGCSSSDGGLTAEPSTTSTAPTSPAPTSAPPATTASVAADVKCQVKGYTPSNAIAIGRRSRPVVLAAIAMRGTGHALTTIGGRRVDAAVHIGTTVSSGAGPLDPAAERQILTVAGGPATMAEVRKLELEAGSPDDKRGRFVLYRGARLDHGTFRLRVCGAPYNDGTTVESIKGTFWASEKPGPSVELSCADEPVGGLAERAHDLGCAG